MKKKLIEGISFDREMARKIWMTMRLIVFLFFVSLIHVSASVYSQKTKLNIKVENATLQQVFETLQQQSEFDFFYKNEQIPADARISIQYQDESIDVILDRILSGTGLTYNILDKDIVISQKTASRTENSQQQIKSVTGKVTDSNGNPLPGVTVVVKGSTTGVITDANGKYSLSNIAGNSSLQFSFVGMKMQLIAVGNQTTINVSLEDETIGIEEVVAVGYGTVKKRDLTGSVASMDNEMIVERGSTSPMESMQGQIAGVQINSNNGRIGGGFDITIRGINTLSKTNAPLYVVDGVPTENIDFLNPQDISRIDILKDASSTAIYGSRGTNGVVLVTTKQASEVDGTYDISYSGYYGIKAVARLPQMMSGDEWWQYRQDAVIAGFKNPMTITKDQVISATGAAWYMDKIDNGNYTDWYDEVLKTGNQRNHHISISGQSKNNISYVIGIGYQGEEGLIDKESIDKYSIKANIYHKINERWAAGTNINFTFTDQQSGSNTAMSDAFRLPPVSSPRDSEGKLILQPGNFVNSSGQEFSMTSTWNPLLTIANSDDNTRNYNILGNAFIEFTPVKKLSMKSTLSFGTFNSRRGRYWGALTDQGNANGKQPMAIVDKDENLNYTWDNQVNYQKTFGDHDINLMGLFSVYSTRSESSSIDVKNLPFDSGIYNVGSAGTINSVGSDYTMATMLSYVTRANYTYKGKYLFTLSNRWDGSSKLSEGNQWSAFPSGAFGWRLSDENFLKGVNVVSNLKLRTSYGYTGNNAVAPYNTKSYANKIVYYDFNGAAANGFIPSNIANNLLTWEKTREMNVGLDFGFYKNRITGSIDVYDKLSKELLMEQRLPLESGWASMQANVGSVSNKGIEMVLKTINVDTKNFTWETTLTFTKNVNKIVEIYGGKDDDIGNNWFIGQPVLVHYNYKYDGVWQASEAEEAKFYGFKEGNAKIVDYGAKGYNANEDRVILGSPLPDWIGSFSTYLKYKNFDFTASMFTNQGVLVFSYFHDNFADVRDRGRQKLKLNYYVPKNSVTAVDGPRASNQYPQPRNEGSFWTSDNVGFYHDASFVKVKNITLGYTLGKTALDALHIKSCRIYTNILNPFVFTKYEGYDPEWGGATLEEGGVSSITYQFGINLHF